MDLTSVATNLERDPDGVWVARTSHQVSYPDEGNDLCFQIEDESFWFQHRNRCIVDLLRRLPPSGNMFDIGGGNGFVARGIEAAGFRTILVEPGVGARNARSRGLETVVQASIEDAGFRPGSMPAAGAFDVMEHIEDDGGFLRLIRDLLPPKGRFYLTVPAFQMLWSVDDDRAGHYRRYTTGGLKRLFSASGFDVEFATYMFAPLVVPVFLARTLPSRLGLRRARTLEQSRREHGAQRGLGTRALQRMLDVEFSILQSGRSIPFGGSCLVAAARR